MAEERQHRQDFTDASWVVPAPPSEGNTDFHMYQLFLLRKAIPGTGHTHKLRERCREPALGKTCEH